MPVDLGKLCGMLNWLLILSSIPVSSSMHIHKLNAKRTITEQLTKISLDMGSEMQTNPVDWIKKFSITWSLPRSTETWISSGVTTAEM